MRFREEHTLMKQPAEGRGNVNFWFFKIEKITFFVSFVFVVYLYPSVLFSLSCSFSILIVNNYFYRKRINRTYGRRKTNQPKVDVSPP